MPVTEAETLVQAAQREILESYRKELDQMISAFRDLDGKAQGTATTSGAFLAATLAYLNRANVLDSTISKALVIFAVIGLACAIAFSLMALRIRRVPGPPSGEDVEKILSTLGNAKTQEELAGRLVYFYGDEASLWRNCVRERREINEEKASWIWSAQRSLLVTAIAVIGLILSIVMQG
jgi:hypothetical protein